MTEETKYVRGSFKQIEGKFGTFYSVGLNKSDLEAIQTNDKGYINLNISKRKYPDKYGNEYSISVNNRKPKEEKKTYIEEENFLPF